MPRVARLQLTITTGESGRVGPVILAFNSHPIPLLDAAGGCGAGETLTATLHPASFAHSVWLEGPDAGVWDIQSVEVTYDSGSGPWTVRFGAARLDDQTSLDIWEERPLPVWDV